MANIFLKLTDITGESKDATHPDEIEVLSWSWGLTQSATFGAGGGGGGVHMNVQDLSFSANISKATTALAKKCANGTHIPEGTLTIRKAGEDPQEFLVFTLEKIIVSSYQTGGASEQAQMIESFSLNIAKVKMEYKTQQDDGTLGPGGEVTIDVPANLVT
jgi:type VI secretion system secreted protein Hcp